MVRQDNLHHSVPFTPINTQVIDSHTPFVAVMMDGQRRELQSTTDLVYDPSRSATSLVQHGNQISWWTYTVGYTVQQIPEEVEETQEISDIINSAMRDAISSGEFEERLVALAPQVRGVSVPGREAEQDGADETDTTAPPTIDSTTDEPKDNPKDGNTQPFEKDSGNRNRIVGFTIAAVCIVLIFAIVAIIFFARRRKRRRSTLPSSPFYFGEQKEHGEVVNVEWSSTNNGESGAKKKGTNCSERSAPSSYMVDRWESGTDGTLDGTDGTLDETDETLEVTAFNSSASVDDRNPESSRAAMSMDSY